MQKGNKGKLRTGTANKATYDWPWRAAKKPRMLSFARECLHFISHVRSSRLVLVFLLSASRFEIYIQAEGISYRNGDFNKTFLSSFIYFT